MQRFGHGKFGEVRLSDLTKSVGVSRRLSEGLTNVSESSLDVPEAPRVDQARWVPDIVRPCRLPTEPNDQGCSYFHYVRAARPSTTRAGLISVQRIFETIEA